jgi:hypothetical protein
MHRLSEAQQKFVRAVRDEVKTLAELMEQQSVNRDQLGKWWGNRFFVIELERAMRLSRKSVKLAVHMSAKVSSVHLESAFVQPKPGQKKPNTPGPRQQSLWRGTIRDDAMLAGRARRGRKKGATSQTPRDLVHPSAKGREQELLAILDGE